MFTAAILDFGWHFEKIIKKFIHFIMFSWAIQKDLHKFDY